MRTNVRVTDARAHALKRKVLARKSAASSSFRKSFHFGGRSPFHEYLLADLKRMHLRLNSGFPAPI